MSNRTTLWVVLVTLLVAPAVGLAAQRLDRLDRYDRARLRAEIHREMRDVARERHRLRDQIGRELRHARDSYRQAWDHTARDAYRDVMRETRRAMREALRSIRD